MANSASASYKHSSMTSSVGLLLATACVGLSLAACSSSSDSPGSDTDAGPKVTCENDPRIVAYSPNMPRTSTQGIFTATLVSSDPAPPVVASQGAYDTWLVRITDANQVPIPDDPKLVTFKTLMPDHGHSSPTQPRITAKGNGTFEISQINFMMAGVWEISIYAQVPSSPVQDFAKFTFCLPG